MSNDNNEIDNKNLISLQEAYNDHRLAEEEEMLLLHDVESFLSTGHVKTQKELEEAVMRLRTMVSLLEERLEASTDRDECNMESQSTDLITRKVKYWLEKNGNQYNYVWGEKAAISYIVSLVSSGGDIRTAVESWLKQCNLS